MPAEDELAILTLATNGPFTTTRAVTRTCSTKKPTSQEVIERMTQLEEEGLGLYKKVDKTKAFYNMLLLEEKKENVEKYLNPEPQQGHS